MKLSYRSGLYLIGGAFLLTWMDPPQGLVTYGLIFMVIIAAAYLDTVLSRPGNAKKADPNVVSLSALRLSRNRRSNPASGSRERRVLQTVYSSAYHGEVNALLHMLRAQGMNAVMVSQNRGPEKNDPIYEVRLPKKEAGQAKPLIQLFLMRSAKAPS